MSASASGLKKLGQPVPLSNFAADENTGNPQPAHSNMPLRRSLSSGLANGGSVAPRRNTRNCSEERRRHQPASL